MNTAKVAITYQRQTELLWAQAVRTEAGDGGGPSPFGSAVRDVQGDLQWTEARR